MKRGEIWWASLPAPRASEPGYRRPIVIISSNEFNESRIQTVLAAIVTSNLKLAAAPGNIPLSKRRSRLTRDSVINVSQLITVDKRFLTERISRLDDQALNSLNSGLKLVLDLRQS